jgi:hypothetical protein
MTKESRMCETFLRRYGLLIKVQMLAFRHPETGIKPNGVESYSDEDLKGIYVYLRDLDDPTQ